ncbi:BtpA/SgcQ family protein [Candidatus Cloacimonadota bacterium]
MKKMLKLLSSRKVIIGMIHVRALPGTPHNSLSVSQIRDLTLKEAEIYKNAGIDAIMLENMHDIPYLNNKVGPEITSAMAVISSAVKKEIDLPCGIQILAGANKEALAVAKSGDLDFIRVENFAYAHVADEGIMESCAGELLRYRKYLDAEGISVFTDVKKKHSSHAITSDVTLKDAIHTHQFFLSDGIIITGTSTGIQPSKEDLLLAEEATSLPIIIGSGITIDNIPIYWDLADGFIIGSHFKEAGKWDNHLSSQRVAKFLKLVDTLRVSK